ncbi:MAG: cation-translocating P-type ATPase [Chloroflexota bacterium]
MTVDSVAEAVQTDLDVGLTEGEVAERLKRYGPNQLREKPGPTFWQQLLEQFASFLILLLIAAAAISLFIGEILDASVIIAIVIVNATIGVYQERQADQALRALQKMAAGRARVIRGGRVTEIPSYDLVPGDVVLLETGNYVPADIRLVEAVNLQANEASLTGESVPVNKDADTVLDPATPLGDLKNSAFMGTVVTRGRGKGIVTATGMHTQIGEIAEMLQAFEERDTPLQRKLADLGKLLGYAIIAICAIVFIAGVVQGRQLMETFLVAVSLAVAAIPEGLPAVVTIVLAIGLQRMVKRHALIRRLPAVETLGAATTIASDKTGTLTKGEMTVVRVYAAGRELEVTGVGYHPEGAFVQDGKTVDVSADPALRLLLQGAVSCNDAILEPSGEAAGQQTWRIVGDPTEGALLTAGGKSGMWRSDLERAYPRRMEVPFSSERKRMTTVHRNPDGDGLAAFMKGAPDVVLSRCSHILTADGIRTLGEEDRRRILEANDRFAADALRVLGITYRHIPENVDAQDLESFEDDMVFVGLMGMIDPPRPEAREAVQVAREAGIRSVMITGDHKRTAVAVANSLTLLRPDGLALSGEELDNMTDDDLASIVEQVDVYARVSPQHKVRVVEALQKKGHIAAMTGDGVNDAPALKRADIGVAMGITGTDVSKEAAAMILTDDNFASIVAAIEEGRIIYANIRKFVAYLLSANLGEIIVVFGGILAGLPLVLSAIQLLWINLVTDSFPALALGVEKSEPGVMKEPPRPPQEGIIAGPLRYWVALQALLQSGATLAAFVVGLAIYPSRIEIAQTMAFATIVGAELLRALSARSLRRTVFSLGVFSNRAMTGALALSFTLLLVVMYLPPLQSAFNTVPLGGEQWAVVGPLILLPFVGSELAKAVGVFK